MREMTVQQVQNYLNSTSLQPLLLDVREPWEYTICSLPNSQLIPMRTIPIALKELDPQQEIIVICRHGNRSRMVAHFLEQQGFKKCYKYVWWDGCLG